MTTKQQWRITLKSATGYATCFVDAKDETAARLFFAQAFPRSTLVSIRLEPTDPCAAYEKRQA